MLQTVINGVCLYQNHLIRKIYRPPSSRSAPIAQRRSRRSGAVTKTVIVSATHVPILDKRR